MFCRAVLEGDSEAIILDGARIHLACCAPREQIELVRICRVGAATRHVDVLAGVTDIVVSVAGCLSLSGEVKQQICCPAANGCHEPCRALAFRMVSGEQAASKLLLCMLLAGGQGLL